MNKALVYRAFEAQRLRLLSRRLGASLPATSLVRLGWRVSGLEGKHSPLLRTWLAETIEGKDIFEKGVGELPQILSLPPQHLAGNAGSHATDDHLLYLR